jgi:hypothetical protein
LNESSRGCAIDRHELSRVSENIKELASRATYGAWRQRVQRPAIVQCSIENLASVARSGAVRLLEDWHVADLEVDPLVAAVLLLEALAGLARQRMAKAQARTGWVVAQCFAVVACLHMQGREMAVSLVLGHSGSTRVLPTWAEHMVKPHAVLAVVVEGQSQSVVKERMGLVQMEKHSTEEATSPEEVPGVGPWVEVVVSVVPAAVLEVARHNLSAGWGTANLQH